MKFLKDDFYPLKKVDSEATSFKNDYSSYWKDSWRKFRKKKVAFIAFIILNFIILNVLFLPFLWRVDPYQIDPTQKSKSPHLGVQALIIKNEKKEHWQAPLIKEIEEEKLEADKLKSTRAIKLVGKANTYSVKLVWEPVFGATGYQVFRSNYLPQKEYLGIPIGRVEGKLGFEDRVDLEDKIYYYTVVAFDYFGDLTDKFTILKVSPRYCLTKKEARNQGFDGIEVGQVIHLNAHPFGTDDQGRDILARLLYGGRVSLFIGIIAPVIFVFMGTIYGLISGFYGGRVDNYMMRFVDFVVALPFLLFMIIFKLLFGVGSGENSIVPMIVALVLLSWPTSARLVRGQTLQLREEAYINASKLLGGSYFYLIFRHILPNLLGLILVSLTFSIPSAIFTEAFLSFIGLGVVPPTASWGQMCRDALVSIQISPHELLFPSLFISLTVLSFNLLGDGLRDALDSKLDY